jgi:hypothetical protein
MVRRSAAFGICSQGAQIARSRVVYQHVDPVVLGHHVADARFDRAIILHIQLAQAELYSRHLGMCLEGSRL